MLPEHPYLCLPAQHSFLPPSFPDCDHSSCRTGVKTPTAPPGVTRQLCVTLHPTIILPLSASFVALIFLLPAHWLRLGLHPSVLPAGLLGNSPLHLPLNPAPHLLILLLIMSICSLWAKQLLTRVIHSLFYCVLTEMHICNSHSTPIIYSSPAFWILTSPAETSAALERKPPQDPTLQCEKAS